MVCDFASAKRVTHQHGLKRDAPTRFEEAAQKSKHTTSPTDTREKKDKKYEKRPKKNYNHNFAGVVEKERDKNNINKAQKTRKHPHTMNKDTNGSTINSH